VRHALADLLTRGDVHDPDLAGVPITVPEVQMSGDLRLATVYVFPLGGAGGEKVVAALERNKRFLRGEVAHRVELRYAPELRFRLDTAFDNAARIEAILRSPEVQRDVAARPDEDEAD
jgi:ribosome-binding factor A